MEALHEEFEDVFSDRLLPGKRINMAPVDIQLEKEAKPRAFYHNNTHYTWRSRLRNWLPHWSQTRFVRSASSRLSGALLCK